MFTRRDFLSAGAIAAGSVAAQFDFLGGAAQAQATGWDAGKLFHLLPMVSHDRALLKCSFQEILSQAPELTIDGKRIVGQRTDSRGRFWEFDIAELKPSTEYRLELRSEGRALAEPWNLSTFPAPDSEIEHVRVVFYTCAGGHDVFGTYQSTATKQAFLSKALSFKPHAIVANGDQVYWDLFAPVQARQMGQSETGIKYAGRFDPTKPIFGTTNEDFILKAAAEQITPLYRTLCRSTPVYFVQDDHDYFDNDIANDRLITFPPNDGMIRLARATQKLVYPEFLPDPNRPIGLAGSHETTGRADISSNYGTLRYGKLLEVLLYDNRRTGTMHGPTAVFVDQHVEDWLKSRMKERTVTHVVNAPGLPPGWTKGNWYEWYPDVYLDGKGSIAKPKPYWQPGWLAQHDRLMEALHQMSGRVPLSISGDIHATALGRMKRTGKLDMSKNPVVTIVPGTVGSMTNYPSGNRGIGIQHPIHLDMQDAWTPVEENGFMVADFHRDRIETAFYIWSHKRQKAEEIAKLEARQRVTLRPVT